MKKQFLLFGMILLSISLLSQNNYLPVNLDVNQNNNNIMPVRELQDHGTDGIVIEYNFPGISVSNISANDDQYQFVHIGGFAKMHEVGKPAMPAHSDFVAVPINSEASVKIINIDYIEFDNFLIHPALQPATDTYGDPEPEFEIDPIQYGTDTFYPTANIEIAETLSYRGNKFVRVRLCPVQHNPVTGKIRVVSRITYEINFSSSTSFFGEKILSENLLNVFPNIILNASSVSNEIKQNLAQNKTAPTDDERSDIIIITNSRYDEAAEALAIWRRQLGYSVEVISQSVWSYDEVEHAIHSRYESWSPAPEFFTIIGDHQDVPGAVLQSPDDNDFASDLYYACMDGANDYIPDMAHGRISVSNSEEATRVIDKIIQYEKNPIDDPSFYQNGVNCAMFQDDENNGYASRRFTHTCENIRDYVMLQGYDANRIYSTESNITPTNYNPGYYSNGEPLPAELLRSNGFEWNGGAQEIINSIEEGRFYVFHRDHGYSGGSGWATPYFTTSSMNSLNNGNKLPVVFSINCHTGEFKLGECFAEKFLRLETGGAVGVFAAAYYSYSGYNDGVSLGFIDAIWSNPGIIPIFGAGGVPNPSLTPHTDIFTMGNVLNQGLLRMMETWDGGYGANKYTHELFHYFGDPTMKIFTAVPIQITAENTDTITFEETTAVEIVNCSFNDGLATLVINGELISSAYLENGIGELDYNDQLGNFAILTISEHNYAPYIDTLFIAGKPIPDFSVSTTSTCNGIVEFTDHTLLNPDNWNWDFGDGETSEIADPTHEYIQNGIFNVTLTVTNSYGTESIVKNELIIVDRPTTPLTTAGVGCENSSIELSASGDGELFWYESLISNNIINIGESFITPELTETTNYFVENALSGISNTGKLDSTGIGDYTSVAGLIFDVISPFKLIAVTVFADGEGEREITLFDSYFNVLTSTIVYLESGENRVELNYEIPEGLGYKLFGNSDCNLYYNTSNFSYPYSIDDVMVITGSTFIPAPVNKYYFFYNWEVESYTCSSPRMEIIAEIQQTTVSDFQHEQNDSTVTFINLSLNAELYSWDFGDGYTSDIESPTHTYSYNGNYTVTLIAENDCSSDTSLGVVVIDSHPNSVIEIAGINSISIFPNPANEEVTINIDVVKDIQTDILLIDIAGKILLTENVILVKGSNTMGLKLGDFDPGVYVIRIKSEKGDFAQKLIIK